MVCRVVIQLGKGELGSAYTFLLYSVVVSLTQRRGSEISKHLKLKFVSLKQIKVKFFELNSTKDRYIHSSGDELEGCRPPNNSHTYGEVSKHVSQRKL